MGNMEQAGCISHVRADLVGCVSLGRGVVTPHLVFQLASMSDSLYFELVCEKDMATPY